MSRRWTFRPEKYQKIDKRHNSVDVVGLRERQAMEAQANASFCIGTLNVDFWRTPKPDYLTDHFNLALSKSVPRRELYAKLRQAFPGGFKKDTVNMELTRSLSIHLLTPLPLGEIRQKLREHLKELLVAS